MATWCTDDLKISRELSHTLVALACDATSQHVSESVASALERLLPSQDVADLSESTNLPFYSHILSHIESLLLSAVTSPSLVNEQILEGCSNFMEDLLESSAGKQALDKFFSESQLVPLLLKPTTPAETISTTQTTNKLSSTSSSTLPTYIVKFFIRLFHLAEKNLNEKSLASICDHINVGSWLEIGRLQTWLSSHLLTTPCTRSK